MKLKQYLKLLKQQKNHKNILKNNLGDAIIYNQNPLVRRVRDAVIRYQYKFTEQDPFHYFSAKLFALNYIKKSRLLPYLPNQKVLHDMEKTCPDTFLLEDIKNIGLTFNASAVHESCHVLAYEIISEVRGTKAFRKDKTYILNSILEEGFTDTVEYLSGIYSKTPEEAFSIYFNTYVRFGGKHEYRIMKYSVKAYGLAKTIEAMILLSTCAHFLYTEIGEKSCSDFFKLTSNPIFTSSPESDEVRNLLFQLMKQSVTPFRIGVAELYFKSVGIKGDIFKVVNFDPAVLMLKQKGIYSETLKKLTDTLCEDYKKRVT